MVVFGTPSASKILYGMRRKERGWGKLAAFGMTAGFSSGIGERTWDRLGGGGYI